MQQLNNVLQLIFSLWTINNPQFSLGLVSTELLPLVSHPLPSLLFLQVFSCLCSRRLLLTWLILIYFLFVYGVMTACINIQKEPNHGSVRSRPRPLLLDSCFVWIITFYTCYLDLDQTEEFEGPDQTKASETCWETSYYWISSDQFMKHNNVHCLYN